MDTEDIERLVEELCDGIGWKGVSRAERIRAWRSEVLEYVLPVVIQFYIRELLKILGHNNTDSPGDLLPPGGQGETP